MLALCHTSGYAYYAGNYASIIGAGLHIATCNHSSVCIGISFSKFELDRSGSELVKFKTNNSSVMETFVYLICTAVSSFTVLAQPAVAQRTNTTLPLTYPGRVLQGSDTQTCPSEEQ